MPAFIWKKEAPTQETYDADDGQGNIMRIVISVDGRLSLSKNNMDMGTVKFDDMAQVKETIASLEGLF